MGLFNFRCTKTLCESAGQWFLTRHPWQRGKLLSRQGAKVISRASMAGGRRWGGVRWSIFSSSWWRSLWASRAVLVSTGRGSASLHSAPLGSGKRKAATLGLWENFLRGHQGMETPLGSSWGNTADLLAVNYCLLVSPACVLTGEGKMCLCSRNCVEC